MNSARRSDGAKYAIPSLRSLQIRLAAPHSRKASLATPRKLCGVFAFCPTRKIRDFSRGDPVCACGFAPTKHPRFAAVLCGDPVVFPQKKCKTFAPLLVPLRCAGTIALLSDFCSAGWAAPAAFLSQGIISNTPQVMRGVRFLPHAKNQRFFPRGPRLCLRLCPTKCPRFAAVLCGDSALFPQKKNARRALAPRGGRLPPPVLFLRTSGFCVVAP